MADPPVAGPSAWYRADLLVTLVSGDVSVWGDSSGTGDSNKNALQATAARRPLWVASRAAFNSQPVVAFTLANNDILKTLTWVTSVSAPWTLYVAWMYGSGGTFKIAASDLTPYNWEVMGYINTTNYFYPLLSSATLTNGVRAYSCYIADAGEPNLYPNNNFDATAPTGTMTTKGLALGNEDPGSFCLGSDLAELILYPTKHNQTDRSAVLTYFRTRYGA